jgi:hypothetical protein
MRLHCAELLSLASTSRAQSEPRDLSDVEAGRRLPQVKAHRIDHRAVEPIEETQ